MVRFPVKLKISRRTTTLVLAPLVALALVTTFLLGFVSSDNALPPSGLLFRAYSSVRHNGAVRRVYYLFNGRGRAQGRWNDARSASGAPGAPGAPGLTEAQQRAMDQLTSIGYVSGYETAGALSSVTMHDSSRAHSGVNLVVSGHAQEVVLMNMGGEVLHRWGFDFADAFPDHPEPRGQPDQEHFRRARLLGGGDLLAIYERQGMIRLDKDSRLMWALPRLCHHDVFVDAAGLIYVLSRAAKIIPRIHKFEPVLEDFITMVDGGGNVVRNVSLLEAFERSSFAAVLDKMPPYGDIFHSNAIEVFDGSGARHSPLFKAGNVLVSLRTVNTVAIIDMEQEQVVWAMSGRWVAQHQPSLLESGNILLFDNRGHYGMSKVIEFEPFTQRVVWTYQGTRDNGFYTETSGSCQRLPNGNTLIIESNAGRAFEVTPGKEIVWEFYNPARAGKDLELIATLFDVVRLSPLTVDGWLARR